MDKNKWVYVGIGAFFLLVLFNSTKNVQLKSVEAPNTTGEQKSFDNSRLPVFLKPPNKLNEGENLPKLNVPKRVLGFTMTPKPRFDII
jgi:hypothetical protein